MSHWQEGDRALCIVPTDNLIEDATYLVTGVIHGGICIRDGIAETGLKLEGAPTSARFTGWDSRRFLKVSCD
jgi:hypothetical protein